MLAPKSEGPTISVLQQNNNNNLSVCGYVNGRQHTFTMDKGATQSIRPDVVKEKCEAESNVRLWTVAGESATVHAKTEAKVIIAKIKVSQVFIVADIVDEVIIGADFMITHGINFNMKQQIMTWRNVEILRDVGYKYQEHARRIVAVKQHKLPPQSESLMWASMKGYCEENRLWVVEPAEIQKELLSAKALIKLTEQKIVPVRVLNLSGHEKIVQCGSMRSSRGGNKQRTTVATCRNVSQG